MSKKKVDIKSDSIKSDTNSKTTDLENVTVPMKNSSGSQLKSVELTVTVADSDTPSRYNSVTDHKSAKP